MTGDISSTTESGPGTWRGVLKTIGADADVGETIAGGAVARINGLVTEVVGPSVAEVMPSGRFGQTIARAEGRVIGGLVGAVHATAKYVGAKLGLE